MLVAQAVGTAVLRAWTNRLRVDLGERDGQLDQPMSDTTSPTTRSWPVARGATQVLKARKVHRLLPSGSGWLPISARERSTGYSLTDDGILTHSSISGRIVGSSISNE